VGVVCGTVVVTTDESVVVVAAVVRSVVDVCMPPATNRNAKTWFITQVNGVITHRKQQEIKKYDNTFAAYSRNVDCCKLLLPFLFLLFSTYH